MIYPETAWLSSVEQQFNRAHNRLRAVGAHGNSLLKTTFKALRNVSLCPWTFGDVVDAALVVLHTDYYPRTI
ncbi:hypothetical protein [Micromonospora craterilacus]|uniref:hypothetical protein n=1 Tax=Micromonospora craterilacus TaxID=1655439 RepID=UPI0018F63640